MKTTLKNAMGLFYFGLAITSALLVGNMWAMDTLPATVVENPFASLCFFLATIFVLSSTSLMLFRKEKASGNVVIMALVATVIGIVSTFF